MSSVVIIYARTVWVLLLQVADDASVPSCGLGEGHIDWFKTPDGCKLNDQAQYTNRHNTWLAVRVPVAVAEVGGAATGNQSINVTPVAMRLKKLMPAIH
jgi:hypothetical protein